MASMADPWYIRLPDGRVVRARSTDSLRRYLQAGRVPFESRVRRSEEDPWQKLERVQEFADLTPRSHSVLDDAPGREPAPSVQADAASELQTLGVSGLVEELLNAFDISLQRTKLTTAACTGLGIGVVLIAGNLASQLAPVDWLWVNWLATALALLVLLSVCTSILTQMTFLELSRYRPATLREIRTGLFAHSARLTFALGLVGGLIVGVLALLHALPGWIAPALPSDGVGAEMLLSIINGIRLILEVLCWPILIFAMLLMGPILIVEDYSIWQALREWLGLLRQHLGRIYLYQAIAFAFAAVMTLPLVVPLLLAFGNPLALSLGESVPFFLLAGAALTPMLAYLLVAHVFIYLNLRYEFFYSARER